MNILVLGSGAREHAMAWKIAQSEKCTKLFVAPGNAGTSSIACNIDLDINNFQEVHKVIKKENIELLLVGPEDPLVGGIVDYFKKEMPHLLIVGPSKEGAMLEGSKDYCKCFMQEENIPTAKYLAVTQDNLEEGLLFLKSLSSPYVLKADGLAAGKGVLILDSLQEAEEELKALLNGKLKEAGKKVLIEEFLSGVECSIFVATDSKNYCILPVAKDHKRIGEGETGPNTGGMGAISPVPFANESFMNKVEQRIITPSIKGLQKRHIDYKGFLFIGLMNVNGEPFVIEYNCRMGDPETEVVMPRINSDFIDLLLAIAQQNIASYHLTVDPRSACTVVLASKGYPANYQKGFPISFSQELKEGEFIFHAGTTTKNNALVTSGGRVLALTALGASLETARKEAYELVESVSFEGKTYRKDIGILSMQ